MVLLIVHEIHQWLLMANNALVQLDELASNGSPNEVNRTSMSNKQNNVVKKTQ